MKLAVALCLLTVCAFAHARMQRVRIKGKITCSEDGNKIKNVKVKLTEEDSEFLNVFLFFLVGVDSKVSR